MSNRKHNLKSGKKNKDKKKGLERENKTGNNKKEKGLMKKSFVIEYFDVVPFIEQKQRTKKRKERDKNNEPKESKKKDKKEERKKITRERERQRKRN